MRLFSFLLLFISTTINAQFTQLWSYKTDGRIFASPVSDTKYIYVGSGDGAFYALHKNSGKLAWTAKLGGGKFSSAALSGMHVITASDNGQLYALDRNSGNEIWRFSSKGEQAKDIWDYYLSTPLVSENIIYWGCGDSCLYAIDAINGEYIWQFKTKGIIHADPVLVDNTLYIAGFDGHLYALDPKNGTLKWKFKSIGAQYFPNGAIPKAPLVKNNMVYFGSRDYNLYALDAISGKCHWNYREPQGWIIATPLLHEGHLFFGLSDGHKMICMNAQNGTIKWEKEINMRVFGSAIIVNGALVFGSHNGLLYALDPKTGDELSTFPTKGHLTNYHKVFNENNHFRADFELYGADLKTSEAKLLNMGSILSTPLYDSEIIYFGAADGYVYALKL